MNDYADGYAAGVRECIRILRETGRDRAADALAERLLPEERQLPVGQVGLPLGER